MGNGSGMEEREGEGNIKGIADKELEIQKRLRKRKSKGSIEV